ncbi:MAG: EmrB/QacA family drug resistance transporter [Bradyrhizobium sp.]|jgi:DHA2 family multidrug resistance protein|nr:EmrB/QacA family drug resistance transporter [Bradyrhizobium sp.]
MCLSAYYAPSASCCSLDGAPTGLRLDWLGFSTLGLGIGALQLFLDRGERLDWFASHEIQIEAAFCVLGFYLFTVHTLSARDPFIEPSLFRNRNFVVGIIMIFIVGLGAAHRLH